MVAPVGSLWLDQVVADGDDLAPRAPLDGDVRADVAIVGAGYTGLWTAYHLLRDDPALRVVVVEREIAGFGASGRNGGWCSALFPASEAKLTRRHGRDAALAMGAAMRDTVDEVGKTVAEEGIACDWVKGGTVTLARTPVQLRRARADGGFLDRGGGVGAGRGRRGCSGRRTRRTARESSPHGSSGGSRGPSSGAAAASTSARRPPRSGPRRVVTDRGVVTAGDRRSGPPRRGRRSSRPRSVVPVYSLIVATRPLPSSFWDAAGLAGGQTFTDHRHLIVYGQRTADDRLVFGGRGAPVPLALADRARVRPRRPGVRGPARGGAGPLPGAAPRPTSPTPGAARWASRATGTRASGSAPTASAGRAATSATASARPTWPGARWPRSCSAAPTR